MKHNKRSFDQVKELGKHLGLPTKQISAILNNKNDTKNLSFSIGPPNYMGSYYGTVSINDFN